MDFYPNGIRRKDGKPVQGVSEELDNKIQDFFKVGLFNGAIVPYNESYKTEYKPNIKNILSYHQFGDENIEHFNVIWDALDPMDEQGLRGITNRKNAYVKALRNEAQRLRTDSKYKNKWKFKGWENNLKAYEDQAQLLERYANTIEALPDISKDDESWYQSAILAGIDPTTTISLFNKETQKYIDFKEKQKEQEQQDKAKEQEELEQNKTKGLQFADPLSTKDPVWYDNTDGKPYTLDDLWQNLTNENAQTIAQSLLSLYGRQQIKSTWGYWSGYSGYLENLTSLFSNPEGDIKVYALTKGALGNAGKKFFIRKLKDKTPTEVTIHQSPDGTYYAKGGGKSYNLGTYDPNAYTQASRTFEDLEDLGKPFTFDIYSVFKDIKSTNDYWYNKNNGLLTYNPESLPTTIFWDMICKLSGLYFKLPKDIQSGKRAYKGSNFYKGANVFIWRFRGHEIKFIFNGNIKTTVKNNLTVFDPSNLAKVSIEPVTRKTGGKIPYLYTGGDLAEYQKKQGTANNVTTTNYNKEGQTTPQQYAQPKKSPETYGAKQPETPFTGADAVRLGASLLDLAGSFMIFPKGLNIASTAVTGTAFLGYLGADIYDVIDGKADLWDTLWNDVKMLGVMAFPMFMNPAKMKAWGAGDRMANLAGQINKWYGTVVTAGFLMDPDMQKSLKSTINKIGNAQFTDFNAQDLSNIAFILRSIGGTKELYNSTKASLKNKKTVKENQTAQIGYRIKSTDAEGKVTYSEPEHIEVTHSSDLTKKNIVQQIVDKKNAELKKVFEEKNKPSEKAEGTKETSEPKPEQTNEQPAAPTISAEQVELINPLEEKILRGDTFRSDDNKKVKVSWETPDEFKSLEYEQWYPNRIWQKATRNGEVLSRENTAFGNWVRKTLKFGDDFDVFFSDYSLVKSSRLGKIERLSKNLYGGIEGLREQCKEFSDILKKQANGELTKAQAEGAILVKMDEYGFNKIFNSKENLLNKAYELAGLYDGTLSKFDNLQLAQALYDLDNPEAPIGKLKEKPASEQQVEGTQSQIETKPSDNTINNREYKSSETITPEELQEAYIKFQKTLDAKNAEGQLSNMQKMSNFDNKELGQDVFSATNKENIVELKKITIDSLTDLISKTKAFNQWKEKSKNLLIPGAVADKIIQEINKKQKLDKKSKLAIKQALTRSLFVDRRIRDQFSKNLFGEPKVLDLGELQQIIRQMSPFKQWIKRATRTQALPPSVHRSIFKELFTKHNYSSKDMNTIGNLLNGTLDQGQFIQSLVSGNTYKQGGIIDFAKKVLKRQSGGPVAIGGIQLSDPDSEENWWDRYGQYLDFDGIKNSLIKYLENEDTRFLFDKNHQESIYQMLKLKSELRKEYHEKYKGNNQAIKDDRVLRYQQWAAKYFPQLIEAANKASENNAYSKNGQYYKTNYDLTNYSADSAYSAITDDWDLLGYEPSLRRLVDSEGGVHNELIEELNEAAKKLGYSIQTDILEDGNTPFSFYLYDYNSDSTQKQNETGLKNEEENELEDEAFVYPLPEEAISKPQKTPRENLNLQKLAYTLGMNALNWDIRNTYKKVPYMQKSYHTFSKEYGDRSQIDLVNRMIGSENVPTSSDARFNAGIAQNRYSRWLTALMEAHNVDRAKREETRKEAAEKIDKNLLNDTNTYNQNLKSFVDAEKEAQEQTASTKLMNATNIKNWAESQFAQRDTFNKARMHYYLEDQRNMLDKIANDEIARINQTYYNLYQDKGKDTTIDNFMVEPAFIHSKNYHEYNVALNEVKARRDASYSRLLDSLYGWPGYWGNSTWRYYKGRDSDIPETSEKEKALMSKQGGKINMAKSGGASVNWVKVENARMTNRTINTVIKETYKNLRQANRDLQKNIRAIEPLIKQLNKRDTVKLK